MATDVPKRRKWWVFASLLLLGGAACASSLAAQDRVRTPQVEATLVPATRSVRPGTPLPVAIRLSVAPGWHVYWKNPGESGLPTTVRWTGPAGFRVAPLRWPYPGRKELSGVTVHAYEGETILLGELRPPPDLPVGRNAEITARIRWGVCREVCIPQEVRLSIRLPVRDRVPPPHSRWRRTADRAESRIPRSPPEGVLRAEWDAAGLRLRIEGELRKRIAAHPLTFFPEDPEVLSAAVSTLPEREGAGWILPLRGPEERMQIPARLRGVLVVSTDGGAAGRVRVLEVDIPVRHP